MQDRRLYGHRQRRHRQHTHARDTLVKLDTQIVMVVIMMLLNARNLHFTGLQKLVSVWLYANSAAHGVYDILGRIGLSVAYTTVLDLLKTLARTHTVP